MKKLFLLILVLPMIGFAEDDAVRPNADQRPDPNSSSLTSNDPHAGASNFAVGAISPEPCHLCEDNVLLGDPTNAISESTGGGTSNTDKTKTGK